MKLDNSLELYHKASGLIPSATQTFSKGPKQYPFGVSPIFLEKGRGSHVWDVDGNEFIDYPMALGAVLLGHSYSVVNEAIERQLQSSIVHTLPHALEGELSELLVNIIPCAEMVRFGKNGSDATAGAVRAARAYTKKDKIVCCGYHGWQDWYIGT
ncbi:MAG: aminotransferase class III-fold pyridoxal phosphate-dependent enzyme, partial [Thermodesulfovibrionia bacterium]|nr:aminotransferase class III-fold pyridoxal phosphate-dependent enzyme [Thermodesulfovibrionia bacterium]